MTAPSTPDPSHIDPEDIGLGEPDFAFRHFLHDVVILLGGRKDIADLLDKSQDGVTRQDVELVRNYAIELFGSTKDRLAGLHKISIKTEPPDEEFWNP